MLRGANLELPNELEMDRRAFSSENVPFGSVLFDPLQTGNPSGLEFQIVTYNLNNNQTVSLSFQDWYVESDHLLQVGNLRYVKLPEEKQTWRSELSN